MTWRDTLATDTEESIVESVVSRVRSSISVKMNLRVVLVMGRGEGGATVRVVLTGGGGTEGEATMARGGVCLRSVFFDTGDKEAGGDGVLGFTEAAYFLRKDFVEACFFVPGDDSIIVSHEDFGWGFVVDTTVAF